MGCNKQTEKLKVRKSCANIGAAVLLCTLTVNLSEFQLFEILLVRPGVKLEIVLAWPDLELVPGVRAMDLSAPAG